MPNRAMELVEEQAEDEGLWFVARTAPEDYLQQALRRLHKAVEEDDASLLAEIARLKIRSEAYEAAYAIAYRGTYQSHNGHWDPTMKHGEGCRECIRSRDVREECDKVIREGQQRLIERAK